MKDTDIIPILMSWPGFVYRSEPLWQKGLMNPV